MPFYPFFGGRDYRKEGTLFLTSLLEDLEKDTQYPERAQFCRPLFVPPDSLATGPSLRFRPASAPTAACCPGSATSSAATALVPHLGSKKIRATDAEAEPSTCPGSASLDLVWVDLRYILFLPVTQSEASKKYTFYITGPRSNHVVEGCNKKPTCNPFLYQLSYYQQQAFGGCVKIGSPKWRVFFLCFPFKPTPKSVPTKQYRLMTRCMNADTSLRDDHQSSVDRTSIGLLKLQGPQKGHALEFGI